MAVNLRLRIAYATAAQWAAWNGILKAGQIGWESDTGKFKVGDDVTTWNALSYSHYTIAEITSLLSGKSDTGHTHVKADITDFAHTHPISDVTSLQTTLDAKEVLANKATDFSVVNDTKYPSVEAVKEQLDLKSSTGHTHVIGDTTGLQAALDAKELLANKATDFSTVNDTKYPTVEAVKEYVDPLVQGLLDDRGNYDASVNTFPASGGSGSAGAIVKGDTWYISVAGTLGGVAVGIGDTIRALVDSPGQTASNWAILEGNIGYVPENVANKDTDTALSANSDTKYASQKAVKAYIDAGLATKAAALGPDDNYVTDAEKVDIGNLSGINTGDQDLSALAPKASPTFTGTVVVPDASLTGVMTFLENSELRLDPALSADGKFCGITEVVTAGETIAFGELVYLKAADSQWYLADADADATSGAVKLAIAVTSGTDNNPMTVLHYGKIRADAKFPALTVGAPAYVSTTPGAVQVAQPSGTDDVIRIAGHALTADELFFNPSNDYITHI